MSYFMYFVIACFLAQATSAAPAIQPHLTPLDNGPGNPDPNAQLWDTASPVVPEPIRGKLGANILGPQNLDLERQNADLLAPPTTDHGQVENLKWPFSLSHIRLSDGGWSREQNSIELHWHKTAEWAYVLKGEVRISTMTPEGYIFVGDVSEGDLWYFPAGNPHSIQAKNTTHEGAEFLLIFDSGTFSEDATFLLTDWLAHVPKNVLAKNFGVTDLTAFDHIPEKELYIFPYLPEHVKPWRIAASPPEDPTADMVIPNNTPNPYVFPLSKVKPTKTPRGSVKLVDSRTFKVAEKISAVEVVVEVGGMSDPGHLRSLIVASNGTRMDLLPVGQLNGKTDSYLTLSPRSSGEARVTVFASEANAHTFNFQAGDVGYIPPTFGHYIENTGNTTLKFLEIFQGGKLLRLHLTSVKEISLTPTDQALSKTSRSPNGLRLLLHHLSKPTLASQTN
ncbi:hypothetical protein C0995_000793 [Termitomyces sp. Mi166|nr:hypothetical protein C0995_000793 [Termitomyces sp. Mi166\